MEGLWILRYRRQLASCACLDSLHEIVSRLQELQMLTEEEIKMLQEFTSPPMQAEVLLDTLVGKGKSYLQALQNCIEFSRFYLYLRMRHYDPLVLKHLERVESKEKHTLLTQLDSLFMVEGLTDAQLQEHDVLQLELRQGGRGTPRQLPLEKLLLPLSEVTFPPHITLTVGVAGAGKSTLVRLFVERWIRGEVCPNITCMMVLNLWELNIYDRLSTEKLLRLASPRQAGPLVGSLLILDGLDELRALLDFSESIACTDPQKELSPECLITNILRGNLLTDTSIWITSRPGAAACIPGGLVDRMTEISGLAEEDARGFLEQLLPDTNGFAQRVWDHLQSHRSLKALCSVPALCRIIGTSLGSLLHAQDSPFLPGTLSAIFSWYLKAVVCDSDGLEQIGSARRTIANLGRLAFNGLIRRRTVFYESDLKSCGIETPLIPGSLCARLLLSQNSPSCLSFAFSHLCLQEFLAAIHYHLAAKRAIFDLFADGAMSWPKLGYMNHYKSAVQKAQHADDLQIPIFLRFLSGLLSPQVLRALSGCLPGKEEPGGHSGAAVDYLHSLLIAGKNVSCRAVNLVCCLQELGHTELIKGVEEDLEKGTLGGKLSMLGCSALAYLLRTSNSCAHETNLSQCLTYKLVQILLPQLQYCTGIRMENNNFKDDVMELLASVLHNKDCTIQRLSLAENRLSNRGVKVLGKALMVNRTLVSLDLHSNSIGPSGVKTLAEALINNQVLLNLNLQNNQIKSEGVQFLAESLQKNRTLKILNIQENKVEAYGAEKLASCLKENSVLQELWLSSNSLGDQGASALADALTVNSSLRILHLQSNSISNHGLSRLTSGLSHNRSLQHLNLRENSISIEGSRALAKSLKRNTTLKHLDLTANLLHDEGADALAEALLENQSLESLHLQWNFLRAGSARSLATALRVNRSLTCLDLQENALGDEGTSALSGALRENSTLLALYLQGTGIGPHGAQSLAEALALNKGLKTLDIRGNNIGLRGAKALAGALKVNSSLQTLNLQENTIGLDGAISLANAVSVNRSLTSISLQGNNIGQAGAKVISDTIKNGAPGCKVEI